MKILVQVAIAEHKAYSSEICELIEKSAQQRGTGISKRSLAYINEKIDQDQAIIALQGDQLVGFCYIESWTNKSYVANSGLVVNPAFRGLGVASRIKQKAFEHSQKKFTKAKLFGLTTSPAVMKINSDLGYRPVIYDELTKDEAFWDGCKSCVNYEILISKDKKNCMCTAMLFDKASDQKWNFMKKSKIYSRFMEMKKKRMLKKQFILL